MNEHVRNPYWTNTATGRRFPLVDPSVDDLCLDDIALHLSAQVRYAGATRRVYTVAEHCLVLLDATRLLGADLDTQRWALLHDAAEAYVTDVPWPLKAAGLVPGLVELERKIQRLVALRWGLSPDEPQLVRDLDLEILDLEAGALLVRHPDWPAGTPRAPRPELCAAWVRRGIDCGLWGARNQARTQLAEWFCAEALTLGLT